MVAEACNQLKKGLSHGDKKGQNLEKVVTQVKYTFAFNGLTSCYFKVLTETTYTFEDKAIPDFIFISNNLTMSPKEIADIYNDATSKYSSVSSNKS